MINQKIIYKLVIGFMLIIFTGCTDVVPESSTPLVSSSSPDLKKSIVLGDISDDPAEVIEGTQPLANFLVSHLSDFGITEGHVKIAASVDEMSRLMATGQVDLYFDSIFPATIVSDASGAYPILRRWRFGVEDYQTVIFASIESGITSIDELPGHILALDSPYSTSGFLLPSVYLIEQGLDLEGKRSYNDSVEEEKVGFVFSYDDENTLQWVIRGLVAAGATDDYNFDIAFPSSVTEELVELARTESVPRQVVVIRSDIDPELRDAIIQILITAHQTEKGMSALEFFQTTKFDQFPEGIDAAKIRMRDMMAIVEDLPRP